MVYFLRTSLFPSPQQTEEYALQFMLEAILHKALHNLKVLIAFDFSALVNTYSNCHHPPRIAHPINQLLIRLPDLKLVHINRRLNSQADSLAQQGKKRGKLLAGWLCSATNITSTVSSWEEVSIMQQLCINTHLHCSSEYLQKDNNHCGWISLEAKYHKYQLSAH